MSADVIDLAKVRRGRAYFDLKERLARDPVFFLEPTGFKMDSWQRCIIEALASGAFSAPKTVRIGWDLARR